jgi:hypothetical protein
MNTYTIHSVFKGQESFLQMSRDLGDLQTSRSKISRWVSEMDVSLSASETTLVIKENGNPILQAKMNNPRLSWRPYTTP